MSSFEIYRLYQKTASSRGNGLAKPQARLLHAVCACNYIHLPLTRQHKLSAFVSRFTPSRRFLKYSTSSKLAIRRLFRHRMEKCRVLHLLNSAKTSVGASTLIVVLVWIMARIHFVRASEASLISNFAQPSERQENLRGKFLANLRSSCAAKVDSSAMFPPRACFCDYPIICKTRHLTNLLRAKAFQRFLQIEEGFFLNLVHSCLCVAFEFTNLCERFWFFAVETIVH